MSSTQSTTHVPARDVEDRWVLFDASQQPLGRLAATIAVLLQGKDRPTYQPSELSGAHVVVTNAAQAVLTGKKEWQKVYHRYSGYPGGLNSYDVANMRERRPEEIVVLAVRRMLPKTRLGARMLSRLKVYPGAEHPHTAQAPQPYEAPSTPA